MINIRSFKHGDLSFALAQTSREGWAASSEQFEVYLEHDPGGCFVAMDGDQPVGMVTTTSFGPSAWIANLIVEPRYRGQGFGRALMVHGLDRLRNMGTTTVRLDGDPDGIPLYRRLGFVDEYESCRFTLEGSAAIAEIDHSAVEMMRRADLDEVARLDADVFGANRSRFLELKINQAEVRVVRRRQGRIVASLLASATDRGLRIGPCIAQSSDDARCVIEAAISSAAGRSVLIGVPILNADGLAILAELGFSRGSSCARMRLGPQVAKGDPSRLFAISSGAVG